MSEERGAVEREEGTPKTPTELVHCLQLSCPLNESAQEKSVNNPEDILMVDIQSGQHTIHQHEDTLLSPEQGKPSLSWG